MTSSDKCVVLVVLVIALCLGGIIGVTHHQKNLMVQLEAQKVHSYINQGYSQYCLEGSTTILWRKDPMYMVINPDGTVEELMVPEGAEI